jgi:hypothetical protein
MYAPSYQRDDAYRQSYEFRWTIATVAALALCAVALVAAAILSVAGDRFEYRNAELTLSRHDDELVQAFEALQTAEAVRRDAQPRFAKNPQISSAASPETGEGSVPPSVDSQCSARSWPYSSDNCVWATDAPKRRRIVFRLKTPWCSGTLRHQPFYRCRTRPK